MAGWVVGKNPPAVVRGVEPGDLPAIGGLVDGPWWLNS